MHVSVTDSPYILHSGAKINKYEIWDIWVLKTVTCEKERQSCNLFAQQQQIISGVWFEIGYCSVPVCWDIETVLNDLSHQLYMQPCKIQSLSRLFTEQA